MERMELPWGYELEEVGQNLLLKRPNGYVLAVFGEGVKPENIQRVAEADEKYLRAVERKDRFGLAAAVTMAASFTVLQAVDGIALKRAVDAWVSAPADLETAAFAAAEAVRWIEIGMNSLSFFLSGLTLLVYGLAIALGSVYPRWVGLMALVSGAALMFHGAVVVAYKGFGPSIPNLVGLVLLAVWAFIMAVFMWRHSSRRRIARLESTPPGPAQQPSSPR